MSLFESGKVSVARKGIGQTGFWGGLIQVKGVGEQREVEERDKR